jgi:hypothetical protein
MEYDASVGPLLAHEVVGLIYRTIQGICQSIDGLHPAVSSATPKWIVPDPKFDFSSSK